MCGRLCPKNSNFWAFVCVVFANNFQNRERLVICYGLGITRNLLPSKMLLHKDETGFKCSLGLERSPFADSAVCKVSQLFWVMSDYRLSIQNIFCQKQNCLDLESKIDLENKYDSCNLLWVNYGKQTWQLVILPFLSFFFFSVEVYKVIYTCLSLIITCC